MNSRSLFFKRISIFICVFCTLISMISLPVMSFVATTDTVYAGDNGNSFDENDYKTVRDGVSEFTYNDSMLLGNANELSGDLAKVSVVLAASAYEEAVIKDCLQSEEMGFTVSPDRVYNYDKTSTYDDNDFVAFMIAHKSITYEGKTYNAYIVPIRGTPTSCEWFSDFNLGKREDGYHEGFKTAADEVLDKIRSQVHTKNNIFFITGHSRGAAVANIVAGELSLSQDLASADRIFGYTYACPAVKKSGVGNFKNIRNYNNPGDAIVALPLQEWGYERYGEDITLPTNGALFDNVKQRFKAVKGGEDYSGKLHTDSFVATLKPLISDEEEFHSATSSLFFDCIAWGLSGESTDLLLQILFLKQSFGVATTLYDIIRGSSYEGIQTRIDEVYQSNLELLNEIDTAIEENARRKNDEPFYISTPLRDSIDSRLGIFVDSDGALSRSRNRLIEAMDTVSSLTSNLVTYNNLFFSEGSSTLLDNISHAHDQTTYILWINAMYYGFEGWYNYEGEINSDIIFNETSCIGDYAFYECTGLTGSPDFTTRLKNLKDIGEFAFGWCTGLTGTLEIPETIGNVGNNAFEYCDGLTKLIMPLDFEVGEEALLDCTGIEEIRYTPGKNGVEPSYTTGSFERNHLSCVKDTLKIITFDEGITIIGDEDYLSSPVDYSSCWNLETVNLPQSLEEIRAGAFYRCEALKNVTLPDNVRKIGDYAFYDCTELTIEPDFKTRFKNLKEIGKQAFRLCSSMTGTLKIPDAIKIGDHAFDSCTGLTGTLEIPDTAEIGKGAFAGCHGFTKLVVPVDYKFKDNTFGWFEKLEEIRYTPGKTGVQPSLGEGYSPGFEGGFIKTISFDEGITKIGDGIYGDSNGDSFITVETVNFPQSHEEIGDYAFYGSVYLKNINLPGNLRKIGKYAFTDCKEIEKVSLSKSLAEVGEYAFHDCFGLTDVYYQGTKADWNRINIAEGNEPLTGATIHYLGGSPETAVKSISLDTKETKITVGDTITLKPAIKPDDATNKAVTWKSSNPKIATVDANGNVKGVKAGAAEITVTTRDGGFTDKCKITVVGKAIEADSISLDKKLIALNKGKSVKLTATVKPDNATDKSVAWSSSNTNVATVDNTGNVTAVNHGTAKITAKTSNGKIAACEVRVNFIDVTNHSSWYYKAVYWAAENGITTGSNGKFNPAADCTREQAITFLWRMAGKPNPKSMVSKFSDVTDTKRYSYKAIMWGAENGYITGSKGKFHPGSACTREQIVTIIWRLAGKPVPKKTNTKFKDVTNPKSYSYKAIMWADEQGIAKGSDGLFRPATKCKRRDIVTFIYRYKN